MVIFNQGVLCWLYQISGCRNWILPQDLLFSLIQWTLVSYIISAASHMNSYYLLLLLFSLPLLVTPHSLSLPLTTLTSFSQFPLSVLPPVSIPTHCNSFTLHHLIFSLSPGDLTSWLLSHLGHFYGYLYHLWVDGSQMFLFPAKTYLLSLSLSSFSLLPVLSISSFIYPHIYPSVCLISLSI